MPRLRFTRDERGYENTFLVHTTRRRGRERTRILYWFRSPPHIKVGRAAFDEDAIRGVEAANRDVVFDWASILEARPPEPEAAEPWRVRRERRARDREGRDTDSRPAPAPLEERRRSERRVPDLAEPPGGGLPDADVEPPDRPATLEPTASERALGAEGLSRVRARYAEVLARISSQVADAAAADELRESAERLNPDAWVTDTEVKAGLEDFERVLEAIRQRLGPPNRARRAATAASSATRSPERSADRPADAPPRGNDGPDRDSD